MLIPDLGITLNQYFRTHRNIKIQCLLTDKKFHEVVKTDGQDDDYTITHGEPVLYDTYTYTSYTVTDKSTGERLGKFQSLQTDDDLYVFSGTSTNFFNKTVLRILKKLYPEVLFAFIHSDSIYNILTQFEKKQNVTLNYDRVVRKIIFGKTPRTQLDWERAKEGREYSTFEQAFQKFEDENMWVDSIRVFSKEQSRKSFHFGVSRKGAVSFYMGRFDVIFSDVLQHITAYSKTQREQFKHRSRSEQPDKKPKLLIVRFGKNIFEKPEIHKKFSKILTKYPNCSYSIVHSGNLHTYLSVLDRNDNSSFAVRTYGNNSLLLIPQIKTSSLSLMRFSEFLSYWFYEGIIENFER